MPNYHVKPFVHSTSLTIPIIHHLMVDEAGCLRITLSTEMWRLEHWRKFESLPDVTCQLVSLHDHVSQFMSNARNP